MRLPQWGSLFRITHRFNGSLDNGALGDMFGLDEGAKIGLEYRIGIVKGGQVGVYRTSDKTIQFFGQSVSSGKAARLPVEVAALASIEGTNNFQDSYSPALGAIVSRRVRRGGGAVRRADLGQQLEPPAEANSWTTTTRS